MGGLWSVLSSVTGLTSHCGTHATPHTSHRYHHTRSLKFVHNPCWDETGWNSRDSGFDTDVLRFLWWGLTEYAKDYFCLNLSFTGEIVFEQYCNVNRWLKSQLIENKMIQNIWVKEKKKNCDYISRGESEAFLYEFKRNCKIFWKGTRIEKPLWTQVMNDTFCYNIQTLFWIQCM